VSRLKARRARAEAVAFVLALAVLVVGGGTLLTVQHALICSKASPELAREIDCSELADSGTERMHDQLRAVVELFGAAFMRSER
jgi:hypothetical protein